MEVKVEFYYPKLEFVSDRTFRESLKLASKKLHQIHLDEVLYIINTSGLSDRLRQSAVDRMAGQLDHIPNYYIESVTRGSLTILVTLSAVAYFVLQKTLGKTIEASWERTPMHKRLVAFLSNTTIAENPNLATPRSSGHITRGLGNDGERWQWLERAFSFQFLNNPKVGRFRVANLTFEEDDAEDMHVRIEFSLAEEYVELEGKFDQFRYNDYISQFSHAPAKKAQKKKRMSSKNEKNSATHKRQS